jgi:UDP-N-acetylmuramoyl-L-alanyl-D-glutamate--2,6-diaminopimelate ligase
VRYLWQGRAFQTRLALIGAFQAENVAVAAGLAIAAGDAPEAVLAVLPRLTGVRGRMQLAATRRNGAAVYVDYAHTPDALETALKALRPHVMGRIIVVFGAGGDRDRTKRPLMGERRARPMPMSFMSPTTTRAPKTPPRSAPRSLPPAPKRTRSATGPRPSCGRSMPCNPATRC